MNIAMITNTYSARLGDKSKSQINEEIFMHSVGFEPQTRTLLRLAD